MTKIDEDLDKSSTMNKVNYVITYNKPHGQT